MLLSPTSAIPPCFMKYRRENRGFLAPSQHGSLIIPSLGATRSSPFAIVVEILAHPAPIPSPLPDPRASRDHPISLATLADSPIAFAAYPPSLERLCRPKTLVPRVPRPVLDPRLCPFRARPPHRCASHALCCPPPPEKNSAGSTRLPCSPTLPIYPHIRSVAGTSTTVRQFGLPTAPAAWACRHPCQAPGPTTPPVRRAF